MVKEVQSRMRNSMNKYSHSLRSTLLYSTAFAVAASAFAVPAIAAEEEEQAETSGAIVVTARKREESLLETPLTIVAVSGEDLEQKGVATMQDLAESTPGININDSSSGHADRSFQQIILRGMTPSTTLATTTSLFIDGVPVASPSAFTAISSPERIEVLKGPQSAYFGRNTFAGAVNVVNSEPSDTWSGSVLGMLGTRENYRVRGEIEGPILGDALTFRLSGERFSKDGSWTNGYTNQTLGDQQSTTGTLYVVAKPAYGLEIKLFGMMAEDEDGPSAQSRVLAYDITDGEGNVLYANQSNCVLNGNPYICGELPWINTGPSANATMTDWTRSLMNSTTNRLVDPEDSVQHYGLLRKTKHFHGTIDYEVNDQISLSLLTGFNDEKWTTLIDLDGFDTSAITSPKAKNGYFDYPYVISRKTKDYSIEGRVNFDFGALTGIVGGSYLNAEIYQGLGNGLNGAFVKGGKSLSETYGAYFGLTYDLTDRLSISAEGRYQVDKVSSYVSASGLTVDGDVFIPGGEYEANSLLASDTFKNFTPRIIANFQATPDFMVYASWAKGVNPSQFNTAILSETELIQQAAYDAGLGLTVEPEELSNYEVGAKGWLFDNTLMYTIAAYYAEWTNQINSILLTLPNGTFDPDTQAENVSFVSGYANTGEVDLYGVEAQLSWKPIDLITLDAGGAINASDIQSFISPTQTALTGITDYSGNEMPYASKYSANVGLMFAGNVRGEEDMSWFFRGDYNYKSGFFVNQANTTWTQDSHKVNFRAGLQKGTVSVQAFVTNAFNNKAYTSATDNYTITADYAYLSTNSAVLVGLPELRTAGIEMKIDF